MEASGPVPDRSSLPAETSGGSRRPRILVGLSGSVACIKADLLVAGLLEFADVRVVATKSAEHFLRDLAFPQAALPARESPPAGNPTRECTTSCRSAPALRLTCEAAVRRKRAVICGVSDAGVSAAADARTRRLRRIIDQVLRDEDEWSRWSKREDPVLHIDLRKWADALLVAPLSANTLAKLANGLCDNLLTCVVRAWDFSRPLLVAPAMNTLMWESPFTAKHLRELEGLGVRVVPPVSKRLVCGDVGTGAMAEVATLVEVARTACESMRQNGLLRHPPPATADGAAPAAGGGGAADR